MAVTHQPSSWWTAERHADRKPFLLARNAITRAMRDWFAAQGFTEVETGILQVRRATRRICTRRAPKWSAATAPARAIFADLAGIRRQETARGRRGENFEFARVFRDRERGELHLPEFTMLEWYRVNEAYQAVIADTLGVIPHAARQRSGAFSFRRRRPIPSPSRTVDGG